MIIYNFFKNLIINIKYTRLIKKAYKEENVLSGLSQIFNSKFRMDWIGRVYSVLNPNLNEDGQYSPNTQIFEYGKGGLNNEAMVEQWVMEKMIIISNFIKTNNLFELLVFSIKKLDNYDNYLFVLEPITLKDCMKWGRRMMWLLGVLIIATITYIYIN